jgi:hypothetical protein
MLLKTMQWESNVDANSRFSGSLPFYHRGGDTEKDTFSSNIGGKTAPQSFQSQKSIK